MPVHVKVDRVLTRRAVVERAEQSVEKQLLEIQGDLKHAVNDAVSQGVLRVEATLKDTEDTLNSLENEAAIQIAKSAVDEEAMEDFVSILEALGAPRRYFW